VAKAKQEKAAKRRSKICEVKARRNDLFCSRARASESSIWTLEIAMDSWQKGERHTVYLGGPWEKSGPSSFKNVQVFENLHICVSSLSVRGALLVTPIQVSFLFFEIQFPSQKVSSDYPEKTDRDNDETSFLSQRLKFTWQDTDINVKGSQGRSEQKGRSSDNNIYMSSIERKSETMETHIHCMPK
jgi:hypothetical protein